MPPDDLFFETYGGMGLSYLVGALFSGGEPYKVGEFYIGNAIDYASGAVPIAFLRIFCSNGWIFEAWPLQRAAMVGGSLAVIYDPWATGAFAGWDADHNIGS